MPLTRTCASDVSIVVNSVGRSWRTSRGNLDRVTKHLDPREGKRRRWYLICQLPDFSRHLLEPGRVQP